MDIGETEKVWTVEPLEDPFERPAPAETPAPAKTPAPEREPVPA